MAAMKQTTLRLAETQKNMLKTLLVVACRYKIIATGGTCGAGSAYPSGAHEITPSFWWGWCCSV